MLCETCLGKHISQELMRAHHTRPIALMLHYKNPRCLERMTALRRVRESAQRSLLEVDRAISELDAKVQEMIDSLVALRATKVEQLQVLKATLAREVPLGLEEVERTLPEERPLLTTQFGPLFRECTQRTAPLRLFTYSLEACSPLALLHFRFQLEATQQLLPASFAGVYHDQAFLYDVGTEKITRKTLSVNFGTAGSYIHLDRERLLCVGAQPASSAVYLLDLHSFQISTLPSLSTPRYAAGVGKLNSRLYAFGGANTSNQGLRSYETLHLSDKHWTNLGSMTHPRGAFTPCHFRGLLYLVSCWTCSNRSVETFNPDTQLCTVLPIILPPLILDAGSVAFVYSEELCVLTERKQMLRWEMGTEQEFRISNTGEMLRISQEPLIVDSMLLIACNGGVSQFCLDTYSYVKRIN